MKSSVSGLLGLVAAGFLVAACAENTVGSDTVRTKGIYASYEVKSTGSSARLVAELRVGGASANTFVYPLVSPDDLKVSVADGPEESLSATCSEDNSYCSGGLGDIGGDQVRVNFDRGDEAENAPNSVVTMPKAFQASIEDDQVTRGDEAVAIELSGDAKNLDYELKGDCIRTRRGSLSSNGIIPAGDVVAWSNQADEDCDVTVTLTRTVQGDIDPAFGKGGRIVAIQERKVQFRSLAGGSEPTPEDAGTDSTTSTESSDAGSTASTEPVVTTDAGVEDGGVTDGGADAMAPDAAAPDAGDESSTLGDSSGGPVDGGQTDGGVPDAG